MYALKLRFHVKKKQLLPCSGWRDGGSVASRWAACTYDRDRPFRSWSICPAGRLWSYPQGKDLPPLWTCVYLTFSTSKEKMFGVDIRYIYGLGYGWSLFVSANHFYIRILYIKINVLFVFLSYIILSRPTLPLRPDLLFNFLCRRNKHIRPKTASRKISYFVNLFISGKKTDMSNAYFKSHRWVCEKKGNFFLFPLYFSLQAQKQSLFLAKHYKRTQPSLSSWPTSYLDWLIMYTC